MTCLAVNLELFNARHIGSCVGGGRIPRAGIEGFGVRKETSALKSCRKGRSWNSVGSGVVLRSLASVHAGSLGIAKNLEFLGRRLGGLNVMTVMGSAGQVELCGGVADNESVLRLTVLKGAEAKSLAWKPG